MLILLYTVFWGRGEERLGLIIHRFFGGATTPLARAERRLRGRGCEERGRESSRHRDLSGDGLRATAYRAIPGRRGGSAGDAVRAARGPCLRLCAAPAGQPGGCGGGDLRGVRTGFRAGGGVPGRGPVSRLAVRHYTQPLPGPAAAAAPAPAGAGGGGAAHGRGAWIGANGDRGTGAPGGSGAAGGISRRADAVRRGGVGGARGGGDTGEVPARHQVTA